MLARNARHRAAGFSPMLEVIVGDITSLAIDAIVNAANPSLLGGAASTVRSIVPQGLASSRNAASSAAARRAKQK